MQFITHCHDLSQRLDAYLAGHAQAEVGVSLSLMTLWIRSASLLNLPVTTWSDSQGHLACLDLVAGSLFWRSMEVSVERLCNLSGTVIIHH